MTKIAHAEPCDIQGTVFSVTYADDRGADANVGIAYLERLARQGYRVLIDACPAKPAYVITASRTGHIIYA